MKLIEALKIAQEPPTGVRPPLAVYLATGFTALHLKTFLVAHLRERLGDRGSTVETSPYGNLAGGLDALPTSAEAVAIVVELSDLDPRLGLRQVGGSGSWEEILAGVREQVDRILAIGRSLAPTRSVAFVPPTLPLPPLFPSAPHRLSAFEASLDSEVDRLALGFVEVGAQVCRVASLEAEGRDLQSELSSGFPYTLSHSSRVGLALARLLAPLAARKALVTDLDGTLWAGTLGEDGIAGLSWDLDHHSQRHGLYQQFLRSLSDRGVLVAALSKNDPDLVSRALGDRSDLILPGSRLFPVVANWEGKGTGFAAILEGLRIDAEDAIFVDDSPMEIAEVKAAHPAVGCLLFPRRDSEMLVFLRELRELLGQDGATPEDGLRAASLRVAIPPQGFSREAFLEEARPEMLLDFAPDPKDPRPLALVNKTNQFNLNGRRYTDAEWHTAGPDTTTILAGYTDKYGPLGRVGFLRGRLANREFFVEVFVLSCRAFSRRIEHQMLLEVLKRTGAEALVFDFVSTPRNGPCADFLESLLEEKPRGPSRVSAGLFHKRCPPLYHRVLHAPEG